MGFHIKSSRRKGEIVDEMINLLEKHKSNSLDKVKTSTALTQANKRLGIKLDEIKIKYLL